jgi:hypothetical protein
MYIATVPNRNSPPALLLREGYRKDGRVKTRTLANLTHWPQERIEALRRCLRGALDAPAEALEPVNDRCFGSLYVLRALAERVGLIAALGNDRQAQLALFLVAARVAHQGSRLSAVRWAQGQAVAEVLGLEAFDEDDLYHTLDGLAEQQEAIEQALYETYLQRHKQPPVLVLYDVTSSYFEGTDNALAEYGYNRDGKRGKKQIVIGLLCDDQGEPLAVRVFRGNTADPDTLSKPVCALKTQFQIQEVVFVGDRGMIKSKGQDLLATSGFRYLTALTDPQIRRLLQRQTLQLELFDETPCEVVDGSRRFILRKNPAVAAKEGHRRQDKLETLTQRVAERNAFVAQAKRAHAERGCATLQAWVKRHRLDAFVSLQCHDRTIDLLVDAAAQHEAAALDGCYVLVTDVPSAVMSPKHVDQRYRDLAQVERDFRAMKTGLLEVRPIFLRKKSRTEGHVFVAMLALKLYRELARQLTATFGTTDDHPHALTVDDALAAFSRFCLLRYELPGQALFRLPKPDNTLTAILGALDLPIPHFTATHPSP